MIGGEYVHDLFTQLPGSSPFEFVLVLSKLCVLPVDPDAASSLEVTLSSEPDSAQEMDIINCPAYKNTREQEW